MENNAFIVEKGMEGYVVGAEEKRWGKFFNGYIVF